MAKGSLMELLSQIPTETGNKLIFVNFTENWNKCDNVLFPKMFASSDRTDIVLSWILNCFIQCLESQAKGAGFAVETFCYYYFYLAPSICLYILVIVIN